MVSRRTRQVLLKLRHLAELEARRALGEAELEVVRATALVGVATATVDSARAKLRAAQTNKTKTAHSRAGELARRDTYLASLRLELEDASRRRREAERSLQMAEERAGQAQETLATALYSSEAARREDRRATEADLRTRDRRLERQAQDRWRPRRDS